MAPHGGRAGTVTVIIEYKLWIYSIRPPHCLTPRQSPGRRQIRHRDQHPTPRLSLGGAGGRNAHGRLRSPHVSPRSGSGVQQRDVGGSSPRPCPSRALPTPPDASEPHRPRGARNPGWPQEGAQSRPGGTGAGFQSAFPPWHVSLPGATHASVTCELTACQPMEGVTQHGQGLEVRGRARTQSQQACSEHASLTRAPCSC